MNTHPIPGCTCSAPASVPLQRTRASRRPFPVVLVSVDLCGLATAKRDKGLPRPMSIGLRVFWCIDVEDSHADPGLLHDYVERVAIDNVRHASVERRGFGGRCK